MFLDHVWNIVFSISAFTSLHTKHVNFGTESHFPFIENANTSELFPMPLCGTFILEEATIDQMQQAMTAGTLTSTQLVQCYLQRTYQTQEYINSVLQINPDVYNIAATMDLERSLGKIRGPLHGIPFTIKDNIASKDNMETTAGSWALVGSIVPRDAYVVTRLREAGAVLLGKAGMSEWADIRSTNYSIGYSARGGQVRNPYNLTVTPGGSSSGSAVGVAANAIAFSIGTDTDGSIIAPARRNAVVGITPTMGLTSRAGVIPESEHMDSVGAFGRTVQDTIAVIDAIHGVDQLDNYTSAQQGKTPPGGYSQYLTDRHALKDAVFGLPWNSFWTFADEEEEQVLLELISLLESAGATIINETEITNYEKLISPAGWDWDYGTTRGYPNESAYTFIKADFYNGIQTYLSELENTNIRSLEDIVAFNYANDGSEGGNPWPLGNPAFYSGQDGLLAALETKGVHDETYNQALHFVQSQTRRGIDDALQHKSRRLSGLLVPTGVAQSYQLAAQAGYPMIALPVYVNSVSGVPFGLGIIQTAWAEADIVKWASAIEDLQLTSGTVYKRTLPTWRDHLRRNIPVIGT